MDNLKEQLKTRIDEIKKITEGMPLRNKLEYIFTYYGLWILGIVCAVSITGYMVYHAFFSVKDYWFYGMYANTMENGGNGSPLWHDFVTYAGYDTSRKKVEMNASSWFDPSVSGGTNNSYFQAFAALVESGDLDLVVVGKEGLQAIGSSGRLLDLNDEKCAFVSRQYADRIITCDPFDQEYSDQPVPVGIDISDSLLVTKYHLYQGNAVLGICAYTKRLESVETFLRFILEEDDLNRLNQTDYYLRE